MFQLCRNIFWAMGALFWGLSTRPPKCLCTCLHIIICVLSLFQWLNYFPPPPLNHRWFDEWFPRALSRWCELLRGGIGSSLLLGPVPAGDARAQLLSPRHAHHGGVDCSYWLPGQHVPDQSWGAVQLPQRWDSGLGSGRRSRSVRVCVCVCVCVCWCVLLSINKSHVTQKNVRSLKRVFYLYFCQSDILFATELHCCSKAIKNTSMLNYSVALGSFNIKEMGTVVYFESVNITKPENQISVNLHLNIVSWRLLKQYLL